MLSGMSGLAKAMSEIVVTVDSPDRTVTVEMAGKGGIKLEVHRGAFAKHTEASLTREVNKTLAGALDAFRQVHEQMRKQIDG